MRVLVFTSSLRVGGAEAMSVALANALAAAGVDAHFASAAGPLRANLDARVTFHVTDNPNQLTLRVSHTLSLLLREIRPDVVHSHGGACAMVASIARRASRVESVRVLTHHSRVFRRAPRWIAGPIMARCADHYVAISRDKQADLESLGIPREKISLIPNGVDVERVASLLDTIDVARVRHDLGIPEGARVLVMAGRVLPAKRFDVFVRVAGEVARRLPHESVHALVVGEGPDLERVRKIARDESKPATIHFLGFQRDIYRCIAISDIVVFPSEHPEVLPMFLIEASAAGRAIVCSDVPGNREIVVDGETGRVVRGGVEAYAHVVASLLEKDAVARGLAESARAAARERFDQKKVARDTIALYQRLLAAREPKG